MIVFDNSQILVVDKPAGWLSVPSRFEGEDTRTVAGRYFEEQLKIRLWPVHRLDQEVTGLLVFAKTAEAHRIAGLWFESRTVQKQYEALSEITPEIPVEKELLWKSKLVRGKRRAYERPFGKDAETRATARLDGNFLRWILLPKTGRPHQLRFEMAKHGVPVLGDALYGSGFKFGEGIALRAVKLGFPESAKELGLPQSVECSGLPLPALPPL